MDPPTIGVALLGAVASAAAFRLTARDAKRTGVSRPRLWACATSGTLAAGVALFVFTSAPIPGILMTAIAGPILYAFERDTATEEDGPIAPGRLPTAPTDDEERESESAGAEREPTDESS